MAVGKTLTIYLAADLKKFNNGMTQAQGGLKGFAGSLKNMLAPALIGAAAAVGALATKMAIDGVKAAMDDEAAMSKLAATMNNLGLAHDTQKVEDYIYQLERSLGIADTELRPAYDRLVRAIGDTEGAQNALSLALDVSAGSGKSLEQVTEALGKAYEGNIAGLSRLGAGIDAATIRTGDMNQITAILASTFSGQAAESANTLEGRLRVLKTGVDNLGEAFGKGLLTGVTDATSGTTDMVKAMEDLEPMLEDVGKSIADAAGLLVDFTKSLYAVQTAIDNAREKTDIWGSSLDTLLNSLNPLKPVFDWLGVGVQVVGAVMGNTEEATEDAGNAAINAVPKWNALYGATMKATEAHLAYLSAHGVKINAIKEANKSYLDLAARQNQVNTYQSIEIEQTETLTTNRGAATAATNLLNKAEQKLADTYDELNTKLDKSATKLANQTELLSEARQAVQDYASGIQQNLLSGIDLETAFTDQFDDTGKATGQSLLDGFNKQIAEAEWFGNVLNELKRQNADKSLIEQIASLGAETGGALGQQLIDDGLVQTMSDKWVNVQNTTKNLAMGLVPEFLIAGQDSAEELVKGTSERLLERSQAFSNMGKNIGKKVGARFKAEFLADIAAAVKEVEAIQTAARAERAASEAARQVTVTDQQVGQALAKIIQRSDNRLGVQGVPVLA